MSAFKNYYVCIGKENAVDFKTKSWSKPEVSVLAGITLSDIDFSGRTLDERLNDVVETDFDMKNGFSIGSEINIYFSPRKDFSLASSVFYSTFHAEGEYVRVLTNQGGMITTSSSIEFSTIRVSVLPRYSAKVGAQKLFFQAGVSFGSLSFSKNEAIGIRNSGNSTSETHGSIILEPFTTYPTAVFGLGFELGKLILDSRLELGGRLGGSMILASNTKRFSFLLGYKL